MYKTQKARGLAWLKNNHSSHKILAHFIVPEFKIYDVQHVAPKSYFYDVDVMMDAWPSFKVPFVRPCPTKPAHGFVESRIARTKHEFLAIANETYNADPRGELIVMDAVPAAFNAIVTPNALVIGRSNDGATAGNGALTIPVTSPLPSPSDIIAEGEVPYLELVRYIKDYAAPEFHNKWLAVQYRSGPASVGGADYVPKRIIVRNVIEPNGEDLLAWKKIIEEASEGTVVYHRNGSLASHYGAHCVANGVPYLTTRKPNVGDTLEPTNGWSKRDLLKLAGYVRAFSNLATDSQKLAQTLAVCHNIGNFVAVKPDDKMLKLLAYSLVAVARYATGASLGELRYSKRVNLAAFKYPFAYNVSRNAIYGSALQMPINECVPMLQMAYVDFGKQWSEAYGGKAWRKATYIALRFVRALVAFTRSARRATLQKMIDPLNELLNVQHNGGWYLNKWWHSFTGNDIAFRPAIVLLDTPDWLFEVAEMPITPIKDKLPTVKLDELYAPDKAPSTYSLVDLARSKKSHEFIETLKNSGYNMAPMTTAPDTSDPGVSVYDAQVTLWFNNAVHFQVAMDRVNRDYGMACDADVQPNLHIAALFHQARIDGVPFKSSLNSSDNIEERYLPVRVAVRNDTVTHVQYNYVWYKVIGAYKS